MNLLLDPNVAYLLLTGGFVLAILALFTPGTGLLEVGALFMLVLAGISLYNLPFNWWALVLLLVGVFPFLLALRKSRQWVFLGLAILALVIGSVFMFKEPGGAPAVHPVLATLTSGISTVLLWIIGRKGIEALSARPVHDLSQLIGLIGEATTHIHAEGSVYVGGEQWSARSVAPIPAKTAVRVMGREGLTLVVEAVGDLKEAALD
jgi:membrane-bound ClpP family serine protease